MASLQKVLRCISTIMRKIQPHGTLKLLGDIEQDFCYHNLDDFSSATITTARY